MITDSKKHILKWIEWLTQSNLSPKNTFIHDNILLFTKIFSDITFLICVYLVAHNNIHKLHSDLNALLCLIGDRSCFEINLCSSFEPLVGCQTMQATHCRNESEGLTLIERHFIGIPNRWTREKKYRGNPFPDSYRPA